MIDGFSILLPTYNMLPWLKICIESIKKNSVLNNQICIHVDGSTDKTINWLMENGIPYTVGNHKGMYSSWNMAGKQATKEYVFLGEDDFYFCPNWDINLARWLEEVDEDTLIIAKCVEPFPGSFPPVVDCGRTPEDFNEAKLLKWVRDNSEHRLVKQVFGMLTIPRKVWEDIGGFDTHYDPVGVGSGDLKMKLHHFNPKFKFRMALDVLVYHFKPTPDIIPYTTSHNNVTNNIKYFIEKWGVKPEEAELIYGGN